MLSPHLNTPPAVPYIQYTHRELAFQIHEVFEALGASIGLKSCCVVGGVDMMTQAIALARKPHIIIATPGRLVDHLENTKGFNLREVRFLILDEVGSIDLAR